LLPDTIDGSLWPKEIDVTVKGFPSADLLQEVRWVKNTDGKQLSVPASGYASLSGDVITLTVPQSGKLDDGTWRIFIKADGLWTEVPRTWDVHRDSATLSRCSSQLDFVNEEAYGQTSNNDYYLDTVEYPAWPHIVTGTFKFYGTGFISSHIQSVGLRQNDKRFFSISAEVVNDNEIDVNFGSMATTLKPGIETDLFFYSEPAEVVAANGVPASGGRLNWRTPRSGTGTPQPPQITDILNSGNGPDGTFISGDVIKVSGKNVLYPVPTATTLILKDDAGDQYLLMNPRLPDDWYTHHYDNDSMVLYFTVPDDLSAAKISGSSDRRADFGTGLVVATSSALGTFDYTTLALEALLAAPPQVKLAVIGAAFEGVSIYVGTQTSTWLIKTIKASSATHTIPTSIPGQAADNQTKDPTDPLALYHVTYIASNVSFISPFDTDLHHLIIKSTPQNSVDVATRAVDRYLRDAYPFRGSFTIDRFDWRTPLTRVAITEIIPLPISPSAPLGVTDPAAVGIPLGYYYCKAQMTSITNLAYSQNFFFVAPDTYDQIGVWNTLQWRWDTYETDYLKPPYLGFTLTAGGGCWRANGTTIPLFMSNDISNYTDVL
jgi:hypothetical protein